MSTVTSPHCQSPSELTTRQFSGLVVNWKSEITIWNDDTRTRFVWCIRCPQGGANFSRRLLSWFLILHAWLDLSVYTCVSPLFKFSPYNTLKDIAMTSFNRCIEHRRGVVLMSLPSRDRHAIIDIPMVSYSEMSSSTALSLFSTWHWLKVRKIRWDVSDFMHSTAACI